MSSGSIGNPSADELVENVTTYVHRSFFFHGYIYPFIFLYGVWAYVWSSWISELENSIEAGSIGLAIIAIIQTLVYLFCHWSVHIRCYLTCNQEEDPKKASLAKVVPTPSNGSPELVNLRRSRVDDEIIVWFMFQECKYEWDCNAKSFQALVYPLDSRLKTYLNHKGFQEDAHISQAEKKFGKNKTMMRIPSFQELFTERATAPFFVFQVFCVLLWCLDEYWMYSVFTLFMLVVFECTLVQQQLRNMSEIRNMGNRTYNIQVYRNRKWRPINTEDILPGDIVSVARSQNEELIPCDMLLLRGPCIVDESMLTGESIPQMKEPIESEFAEGSNEPDRLLDIVNDGKLRILFGGTKVVQHTPPTKSATALRAPDNGCVCYVLRTGFSTSQGKLLRTILYGVKRVTANNLETFAFILFLLIFAIAAASYVWIKGSADPDRNRYKLFLECTLILTSVVPPELPIELSLAVNSSVLSLTKLGVFCTEPFRIPFAGKIDICCFDKTGTLTSDNLVIEGVVSRRGESKNDSTSSNMKVVKAKPEQMGTLSANTIQTLASCHSLVTLEDGTIVGDPLEKATLKWIDWDINKDVVVPKKSSSAPGIRGIKIFHRFHFSSALKRMSVISGFTSTDTQNTEYIAAVKGAPEIMKDMFADAPEDYDEIFQSFSRRGARVLALGIKKLGRLASVDLRQLTRMDIESELSFQGFLIVSCPLKPDSKGVMNEIVNSSHRVVMITGDNPLTACHVAKQLKMVRSDSILVFNPDTMHWESINEAIKIPYESLDHKSLQKGFDLCLTGDGISKLITYQEKDLGTRLSRLLPFIAIYARMAPKQKEWVINSIKARGYHTLMCGDGTNDVGALKHAHVGVAILSSCPEWLEKKKKLIAEIAEKKEQINANPTPAAGPPSTVRNASSRPRRPGASPLGASAGARQPTPEQQWMKMLKELEEEEKAQVVKLGDASIAAPFSSKMSSIECICHIIKQGRCTLVTTLQMFKILALNALILAYSQSVLYLDGIKLSDTQATFHGLLLAACFFFISHSKPLKVLSKNRPIPNIFNAYTLLTVLLQFSIHFYVMISVVKKSLEYAPEDLPEKVDLEKKFEPSLLNSTVYVVSLALQISTFVVNYRGHPFMESITENRPFFYSVLFSTSMVFVILMNMMPDLNAQFEVIPFPSGLQQEMIITFTGDVLGCYLIDRICMRLFGEGKLRIE